MIYQPENVTGMWDPSVVYHDGRWFMFYMIGKNPGEWHRKAMCLAVSDDAVHWEEIGPIVDHRDLPIPVKAGRVWRTADRFMMNHGSIVTSEEGVRQDCIKFWESDDLRKWRSRGEDNLVFADQRWYGVRWDCMDVIPRIPGRTDSGYWGYLTADQRPDWPYFSVGMLQSEDGVSWSVLPPPIFDWGDVPQQGMEVGGCEYICAKYYLILSSRFNYLGNRGYSMFTFISEGPTGPFRPDREAFRLCGTSAVDTLWLSAFCRSPEEPLISTYMCREPIGEDVWFAPLKKAIVDSAGHLRLGYWDGNGSLKGDPITVDFSGNTVLVAGTPTNAGNRTDATTTGIECNSRAAGNTIELWARTRPYRGQLNGPMTVVLLANAFDFDRGLVMEGSVEVTDCSADALVKAHLVPAIFGFYLQTTGTQGVAIELGTTGVTEIGLLSPTGAEQLFESLDVTGRGCATVAGIAAGADVPFRLLVRKDMFELYLDDLFVQSFYLPSPGTGTVGFLVQNGSGRVKDVRCWTMNL